MPKQYHNKPYHMKKENDGYWTVIIEDCPNSGQNKPHTGLNEKDARLIASLPVELYKFLLILQ